MEFGRVQDPGKVDFTLPSTNNLSQKTFDQISASKAPKIYIGCPIWADKGYVGKIYPKGTSSKNYLKEYCKQFNSIEVNATHYQIPKKETIDKWKDAASPGFKFCPKFPQIISHRNDFDQKQEWMDLFLTSIYQLDEFLGTSFIQFPPYFKPQKMEQLNHFFHQLPKEMSFAVELRNESWFENDAVKKEWFDLFQRHNVTAVITDTSGRRDVLHQMLTSNKVFIRFTGNNLHPTDYKRIEDWVPLLLSWIKQGISEVYFFVHEPEKHLCADIATHMVRHFNDKGFEKLKPPRIYGDETATLF